MAAFSLYDGLTLEEERLAELKSAAFVATLRERTVALLSARMLSVGQLQEKLMAKGATDRQAAEVVAWALEIGLLNEEEYAKTLARHYQARGYGMYKIKDELYRRQVPRQYWEQALAELEDPEEFIDAFLTRKVQDPGDRKQIKKPQTPWCAGAFPGVRCLRGLPACAGGLTVPGLERAQTRRRGEDHESRIYFPWLCQESGKL